MTKSRTLFAALCVAVLGLIGLGNAPALAETPLFETTIKDHKFTPDTITVPANTKLKLRVHNEDATPEEFESHDLKLERIIGGGKTGTFIVRPLKPGKYYFFGEFNEDSAKGWLIAE